MRHLKRLGAGLIAMTGIFAVVAVIGWVFWNFAEDCVLTLVAAMILLIAYGIGLGITEDYP